MVMLYLVSPDVSVMGKWNMEGGLKMLSQSIELLNNKKYEEFVENGRFVTSLKAIFLFERLWNELSNGGTQKLIFPTRIVWINGAPGSGKGTNKRNIMRTMGISARPIVVSDLLNNTEAFRAKIDQGLLIDDEDVTSLLFRKLLEENHSKGIIVDGYPRTKIQAECARLLQVKMEKIAPIKMISIVLLIDEKTSIKRQLLRGQNAIEHNKKVSREGVGELIRIRETDVKPEVARSRYHTFQEKTYEALNLLRTFTEYYNIDAKGSLDEVKERIANALKKK
jgi:adenylate kinase